MNLASSSQLSNQTQIIWQCRFTLAQQCGVAEAEDQLDIIGEEMEFSEMHKADEEADTQTIEISNDKAKGTEDRSSAPAQKEFQQRKARLKKQGRLTPGQINHQRETQRALQKGEPTPGQLRAKKERAAQSAKEKATSTSTDEKGSG